LPPLRVDGVSEVPKSSAPRFRGLPVAARLYIPAVLALAALVIALETNTYTGPHVELTLLVVAGVLCAAGNLFEVFAPANFSFQPNLSVFFGATLFLPPWAIAALAVVCFVPGWVVNRFRWYMVVFNMANYALAGAAAFAIVHLDGPLGRASGLGVGTAAALAGAALAFVVINHALIVLVVTLARGRSLRESVEGMLGGFPMDISLAMAGACLAALWASTPTLVLLALGPMVLMYRALWVPLLEHKSRIDSKTGLYNSEYLATELESRLASAQRRGSELSVVMIDLDQLRVINNRHGHLAGDRLIRAVAEVVSQAAVAEDGIAARFGGDELCIALEGRSPEETRQAAEDMRTRIAEIELAFPGSGESLNITASTGIASYPEHADTAEGLLSAADAAVYDAKLGGRNRTRLALPAATRHVIHQESAAPPPGGGAERSPREMGDPRSNGLMPKEPPAPRADEPVGSDRDLYRATLRRRGARRSVVGPPEGLARPLALRPPRQLGRGPRRCAYRCLRASPPLAGCGARARPRLSLRTGRSDRGRGDHRPDPSRAPGSAAQAGV